MISNSDIRPGDANRKDNANAAFEKIVDELKKINEPTAENIRIGAEIFSDYSRYQSWGGNDTSQKRKFKLSKNPDDWDDMVSEYKRATSNGVTFTQRGLQEAKDIFDASPSSDRHKLLFVLTDGAPNRSWTTSDRGITNLEMFPDLKYFTNFNKGSKLNYNAGSSLHSNTERMTTSISPAYNGVINSHITTTNSTAMDLKNSGIEIHTIALKLMINYLEENIPNVRENQIRGLYKMSTKKANATNNPLEDNASDFHFYDVSNGDDLLSYFKNWYETIIRTVDKGVVTDPLGDMVVLVPGSQSVRQIENGAPLFEAGAEPNILLENKDRQIKVDNLNLSRNQEIEIEYKVRLKTEDASFVSGRWYPTNGRTTLEPTPERTTDLLDFGVPSVRYQKKNFVIPVKKVWLDEHQAINELKDFSLKVEKIDSEDNPLTGAVFKLVGPNYEQTINTGSVFNFNNLRPGVYILTEMDNPEGYKKIQDPIGFEIGVDGKVTVNNHPNVSGSGGINGGNNTISLKVTNEKVKPGTLPRTGDYGIKGLFLIASILTIVGVVIAGIYFYKVIKELTRNTRKMNGQ